MDNKKKRKPHIPSNGIKSKYHRKLHEQRLSFIEKLNNQECQKLTEVKKRTINKSSYFKPDVKTLEIGNVPKTFKLSLEHYGPYSLEYSRDGNILLLYGKKGYVSMLNWKTKHLMSEMSVAHTIASATILNRPHFIAVTKQNTISFYDKGTLIHNVDARDETCNLQYLPNHLLLVISTLKGKVMWLDISSGEMQSRTSTNIENITAMNVNTGTGVTAIGDSKGVLSLWTPSQNKAVAYIKCHKSFINNIVSVRNGYEFVTSGFDRKIKVWDTRYLKQTKNDISVKNNIYSLDISEGNLLAAGLDTSCQIIDFKSNQLEPSYTCFKSNSNINDVMFCPNEDVLGITTVSSFDSVLIPDSSTGSFTSQTNPFASKSQQTESMTQALLSKILPDMIATDSNLILKTTRLSTNKK